MSASTASAAMGSSTTQTDRRLLDPILEFHGIRPEQGWALVEVLTRAGHRPRTATVAVRFILRAIYVHEPETFRRRFRPLSLRRPFADRRACARLEPARALEQIARKAPTADDLVLIFGARYATAALMLLPPRPRYGWVVHSILRVLDRALRWIGFR